MPLPPYGETKDVPGTPAWRALHPVGDWFKNAKYNAAYDPMHFGDSNHGMPYQSPTAYQSPEPTQAGSGSAAGLPPQYFEGPNNQGMVNGVPTWQPPVQMPQQDQGQLFQNNNQGGESMIPTWQPPTLGPQVSPSMGTMQQGNRQRRYQSPSTRYLRNQNTF